MWKRVSVLILCYNNQEYLKRALTSVLALDYPNLEIIVSDDCSPKGFDAPAFRDFIETHKKDNLQNYIVRREEVNVGTVQHLTNVLNLFTGDFYMTLGADDFIGIPNTITKMVQAFEESDQEEYLVLGHVRVWTKDLKKNAMFISAAEKALLMKRDARALLETLVYRCCIPTMGALYHRRFYERIKLDDPYYKYTEDWPRYIDMAKAGITPLFLDMIVTNQVLGGVSNGNTVNNVGVYKAFVSEKIHMIDTKVIPILKSLPADVRAKCLARRRQEEKNLILKCEYAQNKGLKKIFYLMRKPKAYFWAKGLTKKVFAESINVWCTRWLNYFAVGLLLLLTWVNCCFLAATPVAQVIGVICGVLGALACLAAGGMLAYKFLWVNRQRLSPLRKFLKI